MFSCRSSSFFFFNDTATTEIYTLSLHDALPICGRFRDRCSTSSRWSCRRSPPCALCLAQSSSSSSPEPWTPRSTVSPRSEEHTSELQSHLNLVCRLLLEKKKNPLTDLHPFPPLF